MPVDVATKATSSAKTAVTAEQILNLALGFMASKQLFVATEIGLFEELRHGPATLEALIGRLNVPRRTLRIVADAMVALRLLDRDDDYYENAEAAQEYLTGQPLDDLRPLLTLWNRISYPAWAQLEQRVLAKEPQIHRGRFTDDDQRVFARGLDALSAAAAREFARSYDFGQHKYILDVSGGTGSFSEAVLHDHPALSVTLFELPGVAALARQRLETDFPEYQISVVEGDFFIDPLPPGHDAIIAANVVHLLSPERNRDLLRRIRSAVAAGARLLLVDLWTDPSRTQPVAAALLAADFLVMTGEGDVYSEKEVRGWLHACGWRPLQRTALTGGWSLLVAEAG